MDALEHKFWSWVKKGQPAECWTWTRSHYASGYPVFNRGYGHRYAFEYGHRISIPLGYQVDHICRNRSCVNPDHLRLATNKQNNENQGLRRDSTSGYRGVALHRHSGLYFAYVTHHGKREYLGYFRTAEEAGEAARRRRLELFTHSEMDVA